MDIQGIINKFRFAKSNTNASEAHTEVVYEISHGRIDTFVESLNELTPDDIAPSKPKQKRTLADFIPSIFRYAVLTVSAVVFIISTFTLVYNFVDYKRADDIYGQISDNIFDESLGSTDPRAVALSQASAKMSAMPDYYTGLSDTAWEDFDADAEGSYNIKFQQMKANLTYLRTINPDIYGYMHIEGTAISYPLVQSNDNEYYLDHAYTGDYMVVGSIFADYRAKEHIEDDRNTVFYGHNINTGTMFHDVTKFFDKEVFESTLIEIYTFDGIYYFKPFAIYDTISTYQYFRMRFEDDEDFVSFCEKMHANSRIKNDTTFTADDQIITLSTCTNFGNGRYALHAKLVKVEK